MTKPELNNRGPRLCASRRCHATWHVVEFNGQTYDVFVVPAAADGLRATVIRDARDEHVATVLAHELDIAPDASDTALALAGVADAIPPRPHLVLVRSTKGYQP